VAPPAGSSFSLVGVRPAVAVPAADPGTSTPSTLPLRLSSTGSTPSAHLLQAPPSSEAPPSAVSTAGIAAAAVSPFAQLLQEFPAVLCPSGELPPVKHKIEHHIETDGRPVSSKYRRLDPIKLAAAKQEFAALERQRVVRRSNSDWSSPLHMVRRLNLQTRADQYTCPNIGDLTARLAGCKIFSMLDL
jgi:hypothetical protein